jgi:hypothetical protein
LTYKKVFCIFHVKLFPSVPTQCEKEAIILSLDSFKTALKLVGSHLPKLSKKFWKKLGHSDSSTIDNNLFGSKPKSS